MNIDQLKGLLEDSKIPSDAYSLNGGFPNEAYVLNLNDALWEVYYSEKGSKSRFACLCRRKWSIYT